MTQRGRKPHLTPEVHGKIIEYLRAGNYLDTAAWMAGVHPQRVHEWLRRGESDDDTSEYAEVYQQFAEDVERAHSEVEARLVHAWQKVAMEGTEKQPGPDWRAIVEFLKRRKPDRWTDRTHLQVEGQVDGEVRHSPAAVVFVPDNGRGQSDDDGG